MEYFILTDGGKQGPFDLITMIKKIKNGVLTSSTMVAQRVEGPFVEANQVPEVAYLIEEHTNPSVATQRHDIKMGLKAYILEGVDLWVRRVLDYTLISGVIMGAGFGVQYIVKSFVSDKSILPSYLSAVLVMALFFQFCYYVLETKRAQQTDFKEFFKVMQRTLPSFLGLSAVFSLFVLPYGLSIEAGLVATIIAMIAITLFIFTPFLATDSQMGVIRAAKLSLQKTLSMGADNFGVVLTIVALNLFAAFLPALLLKELLALGLFISVPITISAIAYIYDQVFV